MDGLFDLVDRKYKVKGPFSIYPSREANGSEIEIESLPEHSYIAIRHNTTLKLADQFKVLKKKLKKSEYDAFCKALEAFVDDRVSEAHFDATYDG